MSEILNAQQLHEIDVRMNGVPMKTAEQHNAPFVGGINTTEYTKEVNGLDQSFSAQLAKQIVQNEQLRFGLLLIQNALECGQPELALAQCKKALGRS